MFNFIENYKKLFVFNVFQECPLTNDENIKREEIKNECKNKPKFNSIENQKKILEKLNKRLKANPDMKFALVCPGGAMKGSWILGVIDGLFKRGFKQVDYALGPSASAGTLAYHTSGQFELGKYIWLNGLADNKEFLQENALIRFITRLFLKALIEWKPFGLEMEKSKKIILHMMYTKESVETILENPKALFSGELNDAPMLLKPQEVIRLFSNDININGKIHGVKLDLEALKNSKTTYIIPVRDNNTKETLYFSNKKDIPNTIYIEGDTFLEALEATKAVPHLTGLNGRTISLSNGEIQGSDGSFSKGALPINHQVLSPRSLPLDHPILSDGKNKIRDDITPIVVFPDNVDKPGTPWIRAITKLVLNILDKEDVGTILDKGEDIRTEEYLKWLKSLAMQGKIILIHNDGEKIDQLNNSQEAMNTNFENGNTTVTKGKNLVIDALIDWTNSENSKYRKRLGIEK